MNFVPLLMWLRHPANDALRSPAPRGNDPHEGAGDSVVTLLEGELHAAGSEMT